MDVLLEAEEGMGCGAEDVLPGACELGGPRGERATELISGILGAGAAESSVVTAL